VAAEDVGRPHKLGVQPEFIQQKDSPASNVCNEAMSFYAQLDSTNDDFIFADCGMIYVFVCFGDNKVTAILQSGGR
jgi:uncharacterized protein YwqG